MNIIGICGYKRSGKDSIGYFLVKHYGYKRYGLADPIREAVKNIFMWTDEQMTGDLKEEIDPRWGISPRQACQHLGTEWGQYDLPKTYPDFNEITGRRLWIKRFRFYVESTMDSQYTHRWFLSDVRFPHEVDVIHKMGGKIIKVIRPSIISTDKHESESHIDSIVPDSTITNDGTLEDLEAAVHRVMSWIYA